MSAIWQLTGLGAGRRRLGARIGVAAAGTAFRLPRLWPVVMGVAVLTFAAAVALATDGPAGEVTAAGPFRLAASRPGLPDRLMLYVGQCTIGGCATICEDVGYCRDFEIDPSNGDCTLELLTDSAGFRTLLDGCPKIAQGAGVEAERLGGFWRLVCVER